VHNCGMGIRKTKHNVCDLKCQPVRVNEYRKHIVGEGVSQYLRIYFLRDAEEYEFWIYTHLISNPH